MRPVARRSLLCLLTLALLLSADLVGAKKKKKKKKKKSKGVKSTANIAFQDHLDKIELQLGECRSADGAGKESKAACLLDSIDKLDKLVIQYPKTPEYWLQRGKYKLEKDFLPGAEKDFDKVLSLDEDFEGLGKWAVIEKAVVYKKKKLYSKGLAMLSALAEELDETFLEASVKRCELLSMNQQWSEAEDMCGSVIESDKELDVDWFDGGLGWTYFYRGQALEKQGKLVPALKDYNECIEAWAYLPDVTNVNVNEASWTQRQLRTAHFQRGDLACAGFCGGEQIGAMRSQLGATADFEAAVADYSYVINSPMTMAGTTNHAVTSARRGMAYLKLEENEHAFADFNAAVESPDGQTEAGWTLNRGLANARLDKWKEALADYTKAIELSPANSMAYSNRGIIYQRRRMWTTAIEDFASAEKAASDQHGKGDAMVHRAFCLLKLGKKEEALEVIGKACSTHKMSYACKYDGEDEIESLDMNTEVGELPNEVEALEGTGEAEDETWIPATALRAKSFEKGEEAKVVGLKQLKEAWEAYDEWSEDYAWQAGQSAFILDLDEEDGTVLLKFTEEAPEVKETEVAVTFQNAPIKHIKAKTLKPFKKRFAKTLVMFYRAASLCGHCPAIKPKFALVADYVMQRTGGKDFSVGAVDCSQKGAPEALCDGIWATHPGVDGSAPGSRSAPRVILFDGEWGEKGERGTPYNDPVNLGEHPGNMRAWLEEQGVAAASATAEVTKDEV